MLACPKCKGSRTRVYGGKAHAAGTMYIRRRQCLTCGHKFRTSEEAARPTADGDWGKKKE
jgi:transcriptional regulator NrdR family protein